MIQLHFDVNQLNIGKSMGVLHLFAWNYVNYANMEGFRRDSHNYQQCTTYMIRYVVVATKLQLKSIYSGMCKASHM